MKRIFIISIVLSTILGCTLFCIDQPAQEKCPYEFEFGGHYLRVPITISPHQKIYHIGDTVHINTIFTDSIYDLSSKHTFKIEKFPFKPVSLLYRFDQNLNWDAGYRVNELIVDDKYKPEYKYLSSVADGYRAQMIYANGQYSFESTIVLKEKGRYLLFFSDVYQSHIGTGHPELNAEADSITFEGKCSWARLYICSMIEGEDNLEYFERELVHLDTAVYEGNIGSVKGAIKALKSGDWAAEFSGMYGFEVVD